MRLRIEGRRAVWAGVRLLDYFPAPLRDNHREAIERHPSRREIVATELANTVVDNAGLGWVHRMLKNTTATADDAVRAYMVASAVFDLPTLWQHARTDAVTSEVAGQLIWESIRILDRASRWLLQHRPQPLDISAEVARLRPTVADPSDSVPGWHRERDHIDYLHRLDPILAAGADQELATTVFGLLERFCLLDATEIAHELNEPSARVAVLYYLVKERRRIDVLLAGISGAPRRRWSGLARLGLRDDLYESIRTMVSGIVTTAPDRDPEQGLQAWEQQVGGRLAKIESVVSASRSGTTWPTSRLPPDRSERWRC